MHVKNTLIKLLVAAAALIPVAAAAQTSSINAFSPYTMFGIGELNTPGTLPMRSMGGAGVAQRSAAVINLLNPAALSAMPQKSFMFNFGLEGQNYYNYQTAEGIAKKSAYNTFNFHDIAFQLPVAKKLGLGFSLTPYSSVGYRTKYTHFYDPNDPVWGNVGSVQYGYQGEGDITEVKVGMGWEIFKNFSVGLAAQYYWGAIDRTFLMVPTSITGDGNFKQSVGADRYHISSFKGQIGLQWNAIINKKRALTFGATYDFGGDLNPQVTKTITIGDNVNTVARGDTTRIALVLPRQLSIGAYYQTTKWALAVDYVFQNWHSANSNNVEYTGLSSGNVGYQVAYTNTSTVKLGVEFTPNRNDVRSLLKRWSYRVGFRYGTYNQSYGIYNDASKSYDHHRIGEYAITAGIGVPVKLFAISSIDVGVEFGRRGYNIAESLGLVRQQYFKFAVGFTFFAGGENGEYWFLRPKYD